MTHLSFNAGRQALDVDLADSAWKHQQGDFVLAPTNATRGPYQQVFVKRFIDRPAAHPLLVTLAAKPVPHTPGLLHYCAQDAYHYYVLARLEGYRDASFYVQSGGDFKRLITPGWVRNLLTQTGAALEEINRRHFYHPDVCFRNLMVRFVRGQDPDFALIDLDSCLPAGSQLPSGIKCDQTWWALFLYNRLSNPAYLNPTMMLGMTLVLGRVLAALRQGAENGAVRGLLLARPDDQRSLFELCERGDSAGFTTLFAPLTSDAAPVTALFATWQAALRALRAGQAPPWPLIHQFTTELLRLVAPAPPPPVRTAPTPATSAGAARSMPPAAAAVPRGPAPGPAPDPAPDRFAAEEARAQAAAALRAAQEALDELQGEQATGPRGRRATQHANAQLKEAQRRLAEAEAACRAAMSRQAAQMAGWNLAAEGMAHSGPAYDDLAERIAAVPAGGTLRLAPGLYRVSGSLALNKPLTLVGSGHSGSGRTVILVAGANPGLFLSNGARCTLRDLAVVSDGNPGDLVWCSTGELTMERCRIEGAAGDGQGGYGVQVYGKGFARLSECLLVDNAGAGVRASGDARLMIERCACVGNGTGIILEQDGRGRATGNLCLNNLQQGIRCAAGGDTQIDDNQCRSNGSDGIALAGRTQALVADNICENNGGSGINAARDAAAAIAHNLCANNKFGIGLGGQSRCDIDGNICLGSRHEGIGFGYGAGGWARNNLCLENLGHGIAVGGQAAPDLDGNQCQRNQDSGIIFWNEAGGRAVGNDCAWNDGAGLRVMDRAHPDLADNFCQGNRGGAIDWPRGRIPKGAVRT